jgi:hypothetical protein
VHDQISLKYASEDRRLLDLEENIQVTPVRRFLDDWGLPQALFHLALAVPVFGAVEYASGDRVLPWGEVSVFLALAGGFCYGWRVRKQMRE